MTAYKFAPILKSVIWGGNKIAELKNLHTDQENIGESWEISGVPGNESVVVDGPEKGLTLTQLIEKHKGNLVGKKIYEEFGDKFPLLVKIIDAKSDLSVQVHPDDALAAKRHNSLGKTEMWYVIDSDPGANMYVGLSKQINPAEYERLVNEDKIMDAITKHDSHPGDLFFLPAGRVHAIGAGNLLAEIQQTSDITYRIYDYGRLDKDGKPRQLHTAEAKDAIDYTVYPEYKQEYDRTAAGDVCLVECDKFKVHKVAVDGDANLPMPEDSFLIIMCLDGDCQVKVDDSQPMGMNKGETILVPASAQQVDVKGNATLLTACV